MAGLIRAYMRAARNGVSAEAFCHSRTFDQLAGGVMLEEVGGLFGNILQEGAAGGMVPPKNASLAERIGRFTRTTTDVGPWKVPARARVQQPMAVPDGILCESLDDVEYRRWRAARTAAGRPTSRIARFVQR